VTLLSVNDGCHWLLILHLFQEGFLLDIGKRLREKDVAHDLAEAEEFLKQHEDLKEDLSTGSRRYFLPRMQYCYCYSQFLLCLLFYCIFPLINRTAAILQQYFSDRYLCIWLPHIPQVILGGLFTFWHIEEVPFTVLCLAARLTRAIVPIITLV